MVLRWSSSNFDTSGYKMTTKNVLILPKSLILGLKYGFGNCLESLDDFDQ